MPRDYNGDLYSKFRRFTYNFQHLETVIGRESRMKQDRKANSKSGQVMLEYVMAVAIFMGVVLMAMLLYDAFQAYGNRALYLIGSEYP